MNSVLSAFLGKQAAQMCFSSSGFARRLPVRLPSTLKRLFFFPGASILRRCRRHVPERSSSLRSVRLAFVCCLQSFLACFLFLATVASKGGGATLANAKHGFSNHFVLEMYCKPKMACRKELTLFASICRCQPRNWEKYWAATGAYRKRLMLGVGNHESS